MKFNQIPDVSSHLSSLFDSHFLLPLLSNLFLSPKVSLIFFFVIITNSIYRDRHSSIILVMGEKVTIMVLKVDLQCPCCYKKVKKILCKFPQIRDQIFNEKANTVTITVVCCDPEKVRDKLCCKGAKVIKSIEIVEPPKPKPPDKPKQPEKPKEPEKTNVVVIPAPNKPEKPKVTFVDPPKEPAKPKDPPKPDPPKAPPPTPPPPTCEYPPVIPARTCCGPCSEGYGGGPCYYGFGVGPPPPPQPCFEGYYGYGYHERPCHATRCDYYFTEENPQSCSIM